MNVTPPRLLFVGLAVAIALPAQDAKPKPASKPDKVAAAPKDGPITANDKAIVALDAFTEKNVSKKQADWKTKLAEPPLQKFDAARDYFWHMETSKGTVKIQLFADTAPKHVTSIIYLARAGFYDGLVFHRVLKHFMAQGGCPLGTGTGGPGYTMDGEFGGTQKHDRPGILSTANTGQPKSDGSQFFLTFVPTPHLDGRHTIAGVTVEGLEVLKALEACGVDGDGQKMVEPPSIVKTWISVAAKAEKPVEPAKKAPGK